MRIGPNAEPININQINALLTNIQHRGADATGIALMNGAKVVVYKEPEIAWKAILGDGFRNFLRENLSEATRICLLHTRAATLGPPERNYNNHPLFNGQVAAIHNGMIHNHDQLFSELKLKRAAETDSDIIRAIVDEWGITRKAIQRLDRMRGSCASAIIDPREPKKLLLLRSGNPLVLAKLGDQIVWASEKKAIHLAARNWSKHWGMFWQANRADLVFNPMATESAWILDEEDMITHADDPAWEPFHSEFSVTSNYVRPSYDVHGKYEDKQKAKDARTEPPKKVHILPAPQEKKTEPIAVNGIPTSSESSTKLATESGASDEVGENDQFIPCENCHVMCAVDVTAQNMEADELVCSNCGNSLKQSIN